MSVINQMLKDLEARQRSGAVPGPVQSAIAGTSRGAGGRAPFRLALAVGGLVVLAGGLGAYVAWRTLDVAAPPVPPVSPAPASSTPAAGTDGRVAASVAPAPRPVDPAPVEAPPPTAAPLAEKPEPPAEAPPPDAVGEAPVPPARQSIDRLPPPDDPLEEVRDLLADGGAAEALARLDAAPSPTPEARALRATALQALGRHREAIDEWAVALERQADVAPWWVGLAISLEAEGRVPEALAAYAQAGRHGPLEPALADYVRGRVDALSATTPR